MDEPTSTLSEREVAQLFRIVADLKARGSAVIYITHKIDEVFRIADAVTVMRDGRVVGSSPVSRLDRDWLITMMVGRELTQLFPKHNVPTDRVLLSVKGSVARRHVLRCVVRRAGGGDPGRCRARRIEED